jgi:antitoxin (DNA-binding transcriptional repressor) of toxin-antitoxin stability system
MNTLITAKELRASFPTVVRRVRKGARYTVIYRSRPAFQLSPVEESSTPAGDAAGDSLYRAAALGRSTDAVAAADHDHLLYAK